MDNRYRPMEKYTHGNVALTIVAVPEPKLKRVMYRLTMAHEDYPFWQQDYKRHGDALNAFNCIANGYKTLKERP